MYAYGVLKSNGTLWTVAGSRYKFLRSRKKGYEKWGDYPAELSESTPGFKWHDVTLDRGRWVGVKEDITLWAWGLNSLHRIYSTNRSSNYLTEFLEKPRQVGSDGDWDRVMNNGFYGIIALKRNGSVWEWDRRPKSSRFKQEVPLADPRPVPELEPFRIRDLTSAHYRGGLFAETTEGQVLCLLRYRRRDRNPIYSFTQALPGHENLFLVDPQVDWRKIDPNDGDSSMVMNRDGTFWYYHQKNHGAFGKRRRGIDASSDWVTWNNMKRYVNVGLKSDGSFWYWRSQWVGKNKTLFESQGLTLSLRDLIPRRFRPVKLGVIDPKIWQ